MNLQLGQKTANWVGLCVALGIFACGDGTTDPPPPEPDPPRATTVAVTPATAELTALGATVRLSANVRDQNGQSMAGAAVEWSSSDPSVATVGAAGLVTAVSNGAATITARSGEASSAVQITVEQAVSAVNLETDSVTITVGDTLRLAATPTDANGHTVSGAAIKWSSSAPGVASVNTSGLVRGISRGKAVVTASSGAAGAQRDHNGPRSIVGHGYAG